ncbi:MAG: hypothetical protein JWP03_2432 [Phycisphaerales bacterium]|nr:hypothetical protein [Phycisphaerales bacterium]
MSIDNSPPHGLPVPPPLPSTSAIVPWDYIAQSLEVSRFFSNGAIDPKLLNDTLNWYGGQGWELVSTFDTATHSGITSTVVLIFKRPRMGV